MQTREFSKVEGMELKAKKTEGDLTPKKNEVLGDNKNKGGDVTPKGKSNIDPSDAGMYSPPEADNEGQRDIEPAYSPANSEDARKLLEYQAEDEKEKQKKFFCPGCPVLVNEYSATVLVLIIVFSKF